MSSKESSGNKPRYLALCGGVGGAKLALGLSHILSPEELLIAVNTGDDFEHLGLTICPDLDTVMYTLADLSNKTQGWGLEGESWHFMQQLQQLGGETWFQLGDKDLATHIQRTQALQAGQSLTEVTHYLCQQLGIQHPVVPMSDQIVSTQIHTKDATLPFQHYFVKSRCEPAVSGFSFAGIEQAQLNPRIQQWLDDGIDAVIVCPSNPFVSIDPMLSLPGFKQQLCDLACPVVAVSPIIGGQAVKGPTAKMMQELAIPQTSEAIAAHYQGLLNGLLIDEQDADSLPRFQAPLQVLATPTLMHDLHSKINLARTVVDFIHRLSSASSAG